MIRIFCKNNGTSTTFPAGCTLLDIYNNLALDIPYGAVAARVNNRVVGLMYRIYRNKDVEFLNITSKDGMKMYVRSLTFVLMKAMHELFPGRVVRFENPISKGYYCRMDDELSEADVEAIKKSMLAIIDRDIPFKRVECSTKEAIEVFSSIGRNDKVRLLETYGSLYTSYYMLEDYIDHYYGGLLPSTGYLKLFEIEKFGDGILLRVPNRETPVTLEDKVPQEKLQERFAERHRWQKLMGVDTIGDFNKAVMAGKGIDLVNVAEVLQEKNMTKNAEQVIKKNRPKI